MINQNEKILVEHYQKSLVVRTSTQPLISDIFINHPLNLTEINPIGISPSSRV